MDKELLQNPHAGEILKEEFLIPFGLSQNTLAKAIDVPPNRIHGIVNGTRGITAETDLLLSKFFGLSEGYWLRLQNLYAIMEAKRSLSDKLARIKIFQLQSSQGRRIKDLI
jgi:addiction module HigA family antidote